VYSISNSIQHFSNWSDSILHTFVGQSACFKQTSWILGSGPRVLFFLSALHFPIRVVYYLWRSVTGLKYNVTLSFLLSTKFHTRQLNAHEQGLFIKKVIFIRLRFVSRRHERIISLSGRNRSWTVVQMPMPLPDLKWACDWVGVECSRTWRSNSEGTIPQRGCGCGWSLLTHCYLDVGGGPDASSIARGQTKGRSKESDK